MAFWPIDGTKLQLPPPSVLGPVPEVAKSPPLLGAIDRESRTSNWTRVRLETPTKQVS